MLSTIKKLTAILVSAVLGTSFLFTIFPLKAHAVTTNTPSGLSPNALKFAINAYQWALKHNAVANPSVLTVVDYSQPSNKKRLWVIDLKDDRVLMHTYVAQARNTGTLYATHFSNNPGSRETSLGIYATMNPYDGEHGQSLHVKGLEPGINSNAESRAIEIHPAPYVTPTFIKTMGFAGRSWGCFAVNPAKAEKLISLIKNGSVLFAYASPEKYDERVNHGLSDAGEALYDGIMGESENPIEWFFHWL